MLFGNTHVKESIGISAAKGFKPRSVTHSGCNGADTTVTLRHLYKLFSHNMRKVRSVTFYRRGGRHSVILIGRFLCGGVSLPLFSLYVNYHALVKLHRLAEQTLCFVIIVSVDRSEVGQSHTLKII